MITDNMVLMFYASVKIKDSSFWNIAVFSCPILAETAYYTEIFIASSFD